MHQTDLQGSTQVINCGSILGEHKWLKTILHRIDYLCRLSWWVHRLDAYNWPKCLFHPQSHSCMHISDYSRLKKSTHTVSIRILKTADGHEASLALSIRHDILVTLNAFGSAGAAIVGWILSWVTQHQCVIYCLWQRIGESRSETLMD